MVWYLQVYQSCTGCRLSGLIVDILGEHVVVASSAAWVEGYRPMIELAISKATNVTRMSWRPSVEILKEEGLQDENLRDTSSSAILAVDEFKVSGSILIPC